MSSDEDINRIEELIQIIKRRKHVLDKTAAIEGIHTTPGIVLHQQEAEKEIQKLENQKQELLAAIVMPEITRRRDAWAQSVADGIVALSDKGLSAEDLAQNEAFTTAFLHASQVAMRTHQKEKLKALRNAVLNTTRVGQLDDDFNLQLTFLNHIDMLSPLHLRVLNFINNPCEDLKLIDRPGMLIDMRDEIDDAAHWYFDDDDVLFHSVAIRVFDIQDRIDIYNQIIADLHNRGLVSARELMPALQADDISFQCPDIYYKIRNSPEISLLGKQFLSFITSPIDDDPDTPTTP